MAEFHFLRPVWLVAIPIGFWLIWRLFGGKHASGSWRRVVDLALQPHVLALPKKLVEQRGPTIIALLGWLVAALALAGPTWERLPVPAFRSDEALVVVFDLSRSMDAADIEPSRLARAKLKLLSLLERRASGQTALVVFSAHAFTVTPLTSDTRTIASLVSALYSDIMPSRGSYAEAGLEKAAQLLRQTGLASGEILLISDADVSPQSLAVSRELSSDGYVVHVLAVGTEEGAPIAKSDGGFITDQSGQVVIPRLNINALQRLADAGHGRFAQITASDSDLDTLFPEQPAAGTLSDSDEQNQEYQADAWRDQGVWFAIVLLPFAALSFRRGWICGLLLCLLLPGPRAQAFEWQDLWKRGDQQGIEAMQAEQPARAASLFQDPQWRAAAQYRGGDYAGSSATLGGLESSDDHYNRGNALARAGQLEAAIDAYDRSLNVNPDHEDAQFNRDLLAELLEQNEDQSDQENQQQQNDPGQQGDQDESSSSEGEQSDDGQSDEQQSAADQGDPQDSTQQGQSDNGQDDPEPTDAESEQDDSDRGEERTAATQPGPQDVEEWADDQAAEQWLRRIPQDPGGLLRRKFLYQYQRLGVDQDGNYVWPGDETEPW